MNMRLAALVKKEYIALLRDKSSILMGVVLPLVLILLIGYGLSLDVKNVPTAVVLEDSSPTARHSVGFTQGSEYFSPVFVTSMAEAEHLMRRQEVDAILRVPSDFTANLYRGSASVQVIVNGVEAMTAMSVVAPPTSATIWPLYWVISMSAPAAAASGRSIIWVRRAPASNMPMISWRFSISLEEADSDITARGRAKMCLPITRITKWLSMMDSMSKSCIVPFCSGRMTSMLLG